MRDNTPGNFLLQSNSFLAISMLVTACLIIPVYNKAYFSDNVRCIALYTMVLLFGAIQFFYNKNKINFYTTDFAWLGLIAFTGASVFWSVNEIYAIYGLATTTLLYLCYKTFEAIEWTEKTAMYLVGTLSFCALVILGIEVMVLKPKLFPFLFTPNSDEKKIVHGITGYNFNFLGSALIVLLPFLLFRTFKKSTVFDVCIIGMVLLVTRFSGSAQIMLGAIFLAVFYAILKLKISGKQVLKLLSGLAVLTIAGLLAAYFYHGQFRGISFVTDEFISQNDRLWMWQTCLQMFTDAPLTGQGKNSWQLLAPAYGLEGCGRCLSDQYMVRFFHHAHNSVFQILAELGTPGLLCYAGIAILPLVQLFRAKLSLPPLALAALTSLLLFFMATMTYGISYNYFNNFSGLTVLAVFNLAILGNLLAQKKTTKFSLNTKAGYSAFILLSIVGLFFFIRFYQAEKDFEQAHILFKQKKYEAATATFQEALPYWDQAAVYKYLATIAQRLGDTETALYYMGSALEKNPYYPYYNLQYGNLLFQSREYELAQEFAYFGHQIAPRFIPLEVLLIKCYFKNGEREKGIEKRDALLKRLRQFVPPPEIAIKRKQRKLTPHIIKRNKKMKRDIEILEKLF